LQSMRAFSIKEIEVFTGIQAHTLRAWEHRFQLLKPCRSKGNYRNYDLEQVRRLLNIALLTKHGYRISGVAGLCQQQLDQAIKSLLMNEGPAKSKAIHDLIYFMFAENTDEFEYVLDCCIHAWGIEFTVDQIILPFLEKVNLVSYYSTGSEVHFVVPLIRRKIILAMETVRVVREEQKKALLFLPEKEHFDLLLLYLAYKLKSLGFRVLYLGTNISLSNLDKVVSEKQPDFLVTYLPPKCKIDLEEYLQALRDFACRLKVFLVKPEDTAAGAEYCNIECIHYKEINKIASRIA